MLNGNDYPSPEVDVGAMDLSSELANQAATEEAVAAAITQAAAAAAAAAAEEEVESSEDQHQDSLQHHHPLSIAEGVVAADSLERAPQPFIALPPQGASLEVPTCRRQRNIVPPPFPFGPPHRQAPDSPLTNSEQLAVLREAYARNPNPGRKELELLAEKTGRPWAKIREYFRQRRNKLRGLADLETMEEPGRASGWLQVTYRPGPSTAVVSQLALYSAYKARFDPYATTAPLLAGQELIQLACATYPGCEMARDEGDYVLRGLQEKEEQEVESEWDREVNALVEPLRGTSWLLSTYQHQSDLSASPSVSQTDLYSAYAARFSSLTPEAAPEAHPGSDAEADAELKEFEANMEADDGGMDEINSFLPSAPEDDSQSNTEPDTPQDIRACNGTPHAAATGDSTPPLPPRENRLLNPVELIALVRMTFPGTDAVVDDNGRFVIRGLERRDAMEKGRNGIRTSDMFPFALISHPTPSDPTHPFTSLLKRKLQLLGPEPGPGPDPGAKRQATSGIGVNMPLSSTGSRVAQGPQGSVGEDLGPEDRELLDGLSRFRNSRLGREVRDVCVQQ